MQRKTAEYRCIPNEVYYDKRISDSDAITYAFLLDECRVRGFSRITNEDFAGMRDVSIRTINRHIKNLKACGYIKIDKDHTRRIYPQILPEY